MFGWRMRVLAVLATAAVAAGLAACGDDDEASTQTGGDTRGQAGAGVSVRIADKGFTESAIVAQAYAQGLEAAGFDADVVSLGSTAIADQAVRRGEIDLYPEYDGTTWLNTLGRTPAQAPASREAFFAAVREGQAGRGLTALPPAPYDNGNNVACTEEAVERFGIRDLSSLGRASGNLVYAANPEHLSRADGLPLLRREYGIRFRDVQTVDIALRYQPIERGTAQCVYAFGTDPQLATLPLTLVEDDKGTFAGRVPFRSYPVVSTRWIDGLSPEARGALEDTLGRVDAALTQEAIQELNARVDLEREDADEVAADFLKEEGITG